MRLTVRQTNVIARPLPTSFLGLQKGILVLRPIRARGDYNKALAIASDLASREHLTREQADYLEVLANNIAAYENKRYKGRKGSPREILEYLCAENQMSGSDLGRILGMRTLGPKILSGERGLSKRHIRILADYFSVSPALFIEQNK